MFNEFADMDQLDRMELLLRKLAREYSVGDCPDCGRKTVVIEIPRGDPSVGIMELASDPSVSALQAGIRCMGCGWFRTFDVVDQGYRFEDLSLDNSLEVHEVIQEVFETGEKGDFYMLEQDDES